MFKTTGGVQYRRLGDRIGQQKPIKRVDGEITAQRVRLRRIRKMNHIGLVAATVTVHPEGCVLGHMTAFAICNMELYRAKVRRAQNRAHRTKLCLWCEFLAIEGREFFSPPPDWLGIAPLKEG